ncbi:MAG: lipid-A-disaccharide synthase [Alphaproteobacteria bacterium]|jgi:lipid-A-disaccharide synthase
MTATDLDRPPRIMLVVGEPSGDALGQQVILALRALTGGRADIIGVGGERMRSAGMQSLYSITDTSVMGLREVVPKVPVILKRIRQVAAFARDTQPDVVVMIDSPDFTHKVARRLRRIAPDMKIVDYVAPQVWASRPGRAKKMAQYFDHVLCLLPFEVPFFQGAGMGASFVGHPAVERAPKPGQGEAFRARHAIPPDARILMLLPGSRSSELRFLWPVFREAIEMTEREAGSFRIVLPTVQTVSRKVHDLVRQWGRDVIVVEDPDDKLGAFDAADVALAASGTVATELALSATPMVIGYRVGALTAAIARRMVRVRYVTLVNLILDREVVPEFIQENCTAPNLSRELVRLLTNHAARVSQVTASTAALKQMGLGDEPPSLRAAREILRIMKEPRRKPDAAPESAS